MSDFVKDKDVLISRQAAIEGFYEMASDTDHLCNISDYVRFLESLTAIPGRKEGKWEVCDILDYAQRPSGRKILRCPFCGYLSDEFRSRHDYYYRLTNFCPNCGARMQSTMGQLRVSEQPTKGEE